MSTPLTIAVRERHTDIVRLLIENGADVNNRGGVRQKCEWHMLCRVQSEFENQIFYECWAKCSKKFRALCISFSWFLSKRYGATSLIIRYASDKMHFIYYCTLSHKLRCYTGISGLEKSRNNTREKISYFLCWYSQSAAYTSLAFGATRSGWWMNGKAFTILNTSCLSELSRIMAAKTLKNPYRWRTMRFSRRGRKPIY